MIHPRAYLNTIVRPALDQLPPMMRGPEAEAHLVAIALQESGLRHRQQINGPARGLHQWETGGIRGVLDHPATWDYAQDACESWLYPIARDTDRLALADSVLAVHQAVRNNDHLDCLFARLALWRLPTPLDGPEHPDSGFAQYQNAWAPGKPHRDRWSDNWRIAWRCVEQES